jgi:hypothetical protein
MNDVYVLIDTRLNQIICPPIKLPNVWANIIGLSLLSDEKLIDLTWAGHPNLSWRNLNNVPIDIDVPDSWLEISKNNIKQLLPDFDVEGVKTPKELLTFFNHIIM